MVRFDPVGVLVSPGDTIRWIVDQNVRTTTACHPDDDGRGALDGGLYRPPRTARSPASTPS
jgi:plastocyanin